MKPVTIRDGMVGRGRRYGPRIDATRLQSFSRWSRNAKASGSVLARVVAVAMLLNAPWLVRMASASTGSTVPRVLVCAGRPVEKPTEMDWCSSACSPYLKAIRWTQWTMAGARGVAVRMTNNGIPSCGQGTWKAHPGFVITLSAPRVVSYCGPSRVQRTLLFTRSNFFPTSLPADHPPCI